MLRRYRGEIRGGPNRVMRTPARSTTRCGALARLVVRVIGKTAPELLVRLAYLIDPATAHMTQISATDDPLVGVVLR
jgi:hypothetical protein